MGTCYCVFIFIYDLGELIGGAQGARGPDGPELRPTRLALRRCCETRFLLLTPTSCVDDA